MADLREQLAAARDVVERTRVAAPVAGTVMDLQVYTQGGVVAAGQRLMDVVPANDRLIIEARARPSTTCSRPSWRAWGARCARSDGPAGAAGAGWCILGA